MDDAYAIPTRRRVNCEFCGRIIDTEAFGTHQYTSGWVKNRAAGGGHAIALPHRENRFACDYCVRRRAEGYEKQESML